MESIKRARKRAGLSLSEVAEHTGLHRVAIARAEREGTDAMASTVAAIADALGVPVCTLYPRSGHERRKPKTKA